MITSTSNPRIKEARKLQRRRERYEQGQLLIEGVRLVRDAWQTGASLRSVFYAPELVSGQESIAELVKQLAATKVDLLPCSKAVFATLSDTVTPQGIAAVVAMPDLPVPASPTLTLVLDQVRDPGNAGTLLRSAAASGVKLVLFGPESVDPFNEKVLRAGMGAHFRIPIHLLVRWEDAAAYVDENHPLYLAEAGGVIAYDAVDWSKPAAIAVGGEAKGAGDWIRKSAIAVHIPMARATESLNAAVAGSVILFEAARQRRAAATRDALSVALTG